MEFPELLSSYIAYKNICRGSHRDSLNYKKVQPVSLFTPSALSSSTLKGNSEGFIPIIFAKNSKFV